LCHNEASLRSARPRPHRPRVVVQVGGVAVPTERQGVLSLRWPTGPRLGLSYSARPVRCRPKVALRRYPMTSTALNVDLLLIQGRKCAMAWARAHTELEDAQS